MRVSFASQITSPTTIRMLRDRQLLEKCNMTDEMVAPFIEIIDKLDETVDIMNAKSEHNGVRKKGRIINSPKHKHLMELLELLSLFTSWKKEAGAFKERTITSESYEDLTWMVFSVVGVATTFLEEDGSQMFDQGRSGSDVLEHHFSNICSKFPSAILQNCEIGTANAQACRSNTFNTKSGGNTAGSRNETVQELFGDIVRKKK